MFVKNFDFAVFITNKIVLFGVTSLNFHSLNALFNYKLL